MGGKTRGKEGGAEDCDYIPCVCIYICIYPDPDSSDILVGGLECYLDRHFGGRTLTYLSNIIIQCLSWYLIAGLDWRARCGPRAISLSSLF